MRLHRFYIQTPISSKTFDISDRDLIHQWRNVFRYNAGSQVIIFDGSGTDYLCIISSLRNLGATVTVIKENKNKVEPCKNIWLCMAIIKKDNFELAVQKVTEIGVTHIVPILCEHSEKKKINFERLQKIVIEASEQSGRGDIPFLHPVTTLDELLNGGTLPQEKVVFHPIRTDELYSPTFNGISPTGISFEQYKNSTDVSSVAVFIGPEGGWSEKEIELFKSYNIPIVSLGSQILRAETSAIAVSSLLLF